MFCSFSKTFHLIVRGKKSPGFLLSQTFLTANVLNSHRGKSTGELLMTLMAPAQHQDMNHDGFQPSKKKPHIYIHICSYFHEACFHVRVSRTHTHTHIPISSSSQSTLTNLGSRCMNTVVTAKHLRLHLERGSPTDAAGCM